MLTWQDRWYIALWVVCQHVDSTLLHESRRWMEIGICYYAVNIIFCIHNHKVYFLKQSNSKHEIKHLHHYIEGTCCPPKRIQTLCEPSPVYLYL